MQLPSPQAERSFALQWVVATIVGWGIGFFVCEAFNAFLAGFTHSDGLLIGTAIGITQGLVLRRRIGSFGWWLLASAVGFGVGKAVGETVAQGMATTAGHGLAGAVIGLSVGAAQWIVLRRHVSRAAWWVPTNIAAWAIGWSFISLAEGSAGLSTVMVYVIGGAGAGAAGIVTAVALIWLARPRPA